MNALKSINPRLKLYYWRQPEAGCSVLFALIRTTVAEEPVQKAPNIMPPPKLWYFMLTEENCLYIKYAGGGEALRRNGKPLGCIRTISAATPRPDTPLQVAKELVQVSHKY